MLSIVYQPETGDSYISRKSVPAGTALSSEEYWAICSEYSAQVRKLEQDVDADVQQMHTDLIAGTFGVPVEQHRQESELRQMDGFVSVGMLTGMPGQQKNL